MLLRLVLIFILTAEAALAGPIAEVKKTVAFVHVVHSKFGLVANGTGFFVGIRSPNDANAIFTYFVTAKHVLQDEKKKFLPSIQVRLNLRKGGTAMETWPLRPANPDRNVFFHDDPSVDLAVIPVALNVELLDVKVITDDLITTKESFETSHISEGTEVFFTGMFSPYMGDQRIYPIVRFGRVALVTPEKVKWDGVLMDLYLMESASYGGNSGSPVFFSLVQEGAPPGALLVVGDPKILLAGVMQGRFDDQQPIQAIQTDIVHVSRSSAGIAAVVPAFKLHEILFNEEMKSARDRQLQK